MYLLERMARSQGKNGSTSIKIKGGAVGALLLEPAAMDTHPDNDYSPVRRLPARLSMVLKGEAVC